MEIIEAHSRQWGRDARNSRDYIEESNPNKLHSADNRLNRSTMGAGEMRIKLLTTNVGYNIHNLTEMHRTSLVIPPTLFSSTIARTSRGKASGFTSAIALSLFLSIAALAQDKVAATPPMGWNSWN